MTQRKENYRKSQLEFIKSITPRVFIRIEFPTSQIKETEISYGTAIELFKDYEELLTLKNNDKSKT